MRGRLGRARALAWRGHFQAALRWSDLAATAAAEIGSSVDHVEALSARAPALAGLGRFEEHLAALRLAIELAPPEHALRTLPARSNLAVGYVTVAQVREGEAAALNVLEESERLGSTVIHGATTALLGWCALLRGDWDGGQHLLDGTADGASSADMVLMARLRTAAAREDADTVRAAAAGLRGLDWFEERHRRKTIEVGAATIGEADAAAVIPTAELEDLVHHALWLPPAVDLLTRARDVEALRAASAWCEALPATRLVDRIVASQRDRLRAWVAGLADDHAVAEAAFAAAHETLWSEGMAYYAACLDVERAELLGRPCRRTSRPPRRCSRRWARSRGPSACARSPRLRSECGRRDSNPHVIADTRT